MARTLKRDRNRLLDKNSIPWLSREDRARERKTLKLFSGLIEKLEEGKTLTEEEQNFLIDYTSSQNSDTWTNACWDTFEKTEANYHRILAQMGQHDLSAYHEYMNPDEPPAHHHYWLCDELMAVEAGEIQLLALSLPPGTAKSTYASRSFTQWFFGRNPSRKVLAVAYAQKFVEAQMSKPCRDTIDTENFRAVFPDVFLSDNDRGATTWKIAEHGGEYTCRGAGAGVAGVRANLLNIDDPIGSVKDSQSEVSREALGQWVTADLLSRRLPGAPIIIVQTRWNSDDPIGRLEKIHADDPHALPGPVKFVNIPAIAGDDDLLGRKPGEYIWPEFYSSGHFETLKKTMSPALWSALYMGVPLDKMGMFVAEEQFQRYEKYPVNKPNEPMQIKSTVVSVDTAQKGTERSAYTAIEVFREDFEGQHYLVYATRVQDKLEDVVKLLRTVAVNWSADYILLEDAGQGSQIIENFANLFPCPIVSCSARGKGSKEFMFDAATPWITSGKIKFPHMADWLTDLINELVAFPDGKYKDYVDAFSQYCAHKSETKRGGTRRLVMGA